MLYHCRFIFYLTRMKHHLIEMTLLSDKQLFKEVSEGNEQAFQQLYNRYYQRIYSFAVKVVKSTHVAEEVVQEVFIRLWEQRELLSEVKSPDNYLFIVIRNHVFNHLRTAANELNRREQLWEAFQQRVADEATTLEAQEAEQFLDLLLAKLSPQQRIIFRMSREEGFSHQQIADELHLSKNTVKKHIANSLKIFKTHLRNYIQLLFMF